jgi:myo-inositol-1(or 4)-monophosphatase
MADESFTEDKLKELLSIAMEAARAGALVHEGARRDALEVDAKFSSNDLVTEIDREAERQVVSIIHAARPDDAILGEEGTQVTGSSGVRWIIDPLDGTTNFVHGYPAHAVSVGVEIKGERALGVVHDTFHDCVYTGIVRFGAQCDDKTINARTETELSRALIGTGFLPDRDVRRAQAEVLRHVLPCVRDVRRSGCPSLDLCAVASGKLDGFYESGLGLWDRAAGAAIAEAAGAKVVELRSHTLPNPLLVAANAKLLEALVSILVESGAVEA